MDNWWSWRRLSIVVCDSFCVGRWDVGGIGVVMAQVGGDVVCLSRGRCVDGVVGVGSGWVLRSWATSWSRDGLSRHALRL